MKLQKKIFLELAIQFVIISVGVFGMALLYNNNLLLTLLFCIVTTTGFVFWHSKSDILVFFTAAIIGTAAEILNVGYGAWSYKNPTFLGIPIWLPFAWGVSFFIIKKMSETLSFNS